MENTEVIKEEVTKHVNFQQEVLHLLDEMNMI